MENLIGLFLAHTNDTEVNGNIFRNNTNKDIAIEIIGKRPGEKISELLLTKEEAEYAIEKDNMFIIK